ncbi:putative general amidase GmdA [Aspergillus homomorphus CBS 101889]|uniref:amidase n=1 Tax=Aspergillus homomorphus (strain CBS 101889) TaxID=1450537 RepID=A0A395I9M0_ASPHC|nr:general amidase GmdA [Aspergillus homomorphus CBS 101889]RAL15913.1 general amidase GmdA [Aspergillus homomorphus CBS 101889]
MATTPPRWQEKAAAKRQAIFEAIPAQWRIQERLPSDDEQPDVTGKYIQQYLTDREIEITECDALSITERTTTGAWTALEVTEAFCHRAAIAHQLVNCLLEIFFDQAITSAKALDAYFAEHKKPLGPLHGLPVSLKDQFHIKGVETTIGYVGWIGTFEGQRKLETSARTHESELVRELRNLGAVLFCKTSVPTTLMAAETANNIVGYTWNPTNRHLSAGGSSGGEGALIALRGSPAGFGTDIGGSIRLPATFNGIFGLRPSAGRMPYEGAANTMDGQNCMLSVVGPMATTARSLKLLFKAVLLQEPWYHDPLALQLPWREAVEQQAARDRLCFGIMYDDGKVQPHPPVKRALALVRRLLEAQGHRVIEWNPPSHQTAFDIAMQIFHLDGRADIQAHLALSGEEQRAECFLQPSEPQNAMQIAALNIQKRQYQKEYLVYWNSTAALTGTGRPVDALICSTCPYAAFLPGQYKHGDTPFVNVLDYPAVVFPVTYADRVVDKAERPDVFLSEMDEVIQSQYDCDVAHGAPVGLQLVGRRLEDEKVLALVEYVGRLLQKDTQST